MSRVGAGERVPRSTVVKEVYGERERGLGRSGSPTCRKTPTGHETPKTCVETFVGEDV